MILRGARLIFRITVFLDIFVPHEENNKGIICFEKSKIRDSQSVFILDFRIVVIIFIIISQKIKLKKNIN